MCKFWIGFAVTLFMCTLLVVSAALWLVEQPVMQDAVTFVWGVN